MAHQGGMLKTKMERRKMFKKIETLEYKINELNRPDAIMFLYVPYENALILKKNREESPDQLESSSIYLKNSERTYLELVDLYKYTKIDCVSDNIMRSIEDINDELYNKVKEVINS